MPSILGVVFRFPKGPILYKMMMIKIFRQLCFFSWKLKLMFLKAAFPRALVKTEAKMPLL